MQKRLIVAIVAIALIGVGLLATVQGLRLFLFDARSPAMTPTPARPEQRLIPTPTRRETVAFSPSPLPSGTMVDAPMPSSIATPGPTAMLQSAAVPGERPGLFSPRQRIGIVAVMSGVEKQEVADLGAGWYHPCHTANDSLRLAGMECAGGVWVTGSTYTPDAITLQETARSDPGRLWLVGNEPDVVWQGNATPQEYAQVFHDVYQTLKSADPTCQVAIGGVSQVTPLRLDYLEAVLAAYEEVHGQSMPVDVWNIHLAILREERGAWGVDIPPGLPDDMGILYEIRDNANVEILKSQVVAFRRWMAERGLRDKPLIVTELSVLMPPDYGFPFERVRDFMIAAFDFLMTATDENLGYPADGNRLVQRWAWYSVADKIYYTGNLFDPDTGLITPLGSSFAEYVAGW